MKKIVSIVMILVLILSFANVVNAANFSAGMTLRPSSTTINPGDTVNVDVVINNITLSDGAKGIAAIGATLEYDTNIFESVKKSNIDVGDDRSLMVNGNRLLVSLDNEDGLIKTNGTVAFTVTFKAKADASISTTTITLKDVEITDNMGRVEIPSVSTELTKPEERPTSYTFLEGANQTYTINKDDTLRFAINADYSLFENGGKVYVDNTLVESSKYTSQSGSTIIVFTKDYASSLSVGEHALKVSFNDGVDATTNFNVAKEGTSQTNTITPVIRNTTNKTTNTAKDTTSSTKILPKTGANTIVTSAVIIAVVAISIVVYSRYHSMRDVK